MNLNMGFDFQVLIIKLVSLGSIHKRYRDICCGFSILHSNTSSQVLTIKARHCIVIPGDLCIFIISGK